MLVTYRLGLMSTTQSTPVELSDELVDEARGVAAWHHRSLGGQIEYWAAMGRAVEANLPGDAVARLLERMGGPMTISPVAEGTQRQEAMNVLATFLEQPKDDTSWLAEMSARGIPLYGSEACKPGQIQRRTSDGSVDELLPGPCRPGESAP